MSTAHPNRPVLTALPSPDSPRQGRWSWTGCCETLDEYLPPLLAALVKQILCQIAAKDGLRHDPTFGFLSFLVSGRQQTGKSLAADIVCQILGLDPTLHVLYTDQHSPGELFGRRFGSVWEPADILGYLFAGLDEYDKVKLREKREATYRLLQGRLWVPAGRGGRKVEVRPVVAAFMNDPYTEVFDGRGDLLRRAVRARTDDLAGCRDQLEAAYNALIATSRLQHLNLGSLPPASPLPDTAYRQLRRALLDGLNPQGQDLLDAPRVAANAVGLLRLAPVFDPVQAALEVGDYYLITAASAGDTAKEGEVGPAAAALPSTEERRRKAQADRERILAKRRQANADQTRLDGAKGQAIGRLRAICPDPEVFPDYQRPFVEGVIRKIDGRIARIDAAGSLEEVAEIVDHAEQDRVFDEARQCKNLEEVILAQAARAPLALEASHVIDVPGWEVDHEELPNSDQGNPGYLCADCRKLFSEPEEDGDGECYCPNCGVLLTDENCLKAEDLDSLPPKPRPTLLEVLVEHLVAVRSS
jgi:hypothetical protein